VRLRGDALGMLETSSIAAGVRATDQVLKTAQVHLVEACPISPGKFLVVFSGGVAEVEASLGAGRAICVPHLVDELLLPRVHADVAPAIERTGEIGELGVAIGVVETLSVAATIVGADAAAKAARVRLLEIGAGRGIGGKGFFTMTGEVAAVEAAAQAARAVVDLRGYHLHTEILAGPHATLARRVGRGLLRGDRQLGGGDEEE
jgi:microcompartment protein CcmL/EutN